MLAYLDISFVEKKYEEMEEWNEDKDSLNLPFAKLPYLIHETSEEARISGPHPIMKYLAATYMPSLLGRSP